jgi:DNA-binding CsgD family transcriptional regulator
MINTYNSLKPLANLYNGETNLSQVAVTYQQSNDPILFAFAFCEVYPLLKLQADKYFYLNEADKASILLEEVNKALNDYQPIYCTKVQTLITTYVNRRFYAETKMLQHDRRKINIGVDSYETMVEFQDEETIESIGYKDIELGESLPKAKLTENELTYCKIVMNETTSLRDSDVARAMGISPAGVLWLKKKVKEKLISSHIIEGCLV